MPINNFKELERLELEERKVRKEEVKRGIHKNMKIFHFLGDIVELFLPRFFYSLMNMSQETSSKRRNKYPNTGER